MADNINALYPQPQTPQPGLMTGDPSRLIGMVGQMQQIQGRNAMGEAWRNALQPDGSIDHATLMKGAANAGVMAPDAVTAALAQRQQDQQYQAAQFEQGVKQNNYAMSLFGSYADKPTVTNEDIHNLTTNIARNFPKMPISAINNWSRSLLAMDPVKRKETIGMMRNAAMGPEAQTTPDTGAPQAGTGAPVSINRGQAALERSGIGGAPGAGTGAPAPMPGQGPAPVAQRGIVGLPPGSDKSSTEMQNDLIHAGNWGQEMLPLNQALDAANRLKTKYGTGYFAPGSEGRQEFQSFWYGVSPKFAQFLGVDPAKLQDYAEAKKYLTQATASRVGGFGAGTEAQLKTAAGGSPSVNINDMAVDGVLKMMIAARRMEHVQTLQSAQQGGPKYTDNKAKWSTKQDPRVYMIDLMPPDEIRKLDKSLKGKDREKFNSSLAAAVETGVISYDAVRTALAGAK